MNILTLEQLLQLHTFVVRETGGSSGLRDLGRLESVVASQIQNAFGEDLNSSTVEKSAAIIRGIIADHPFVDGNERTALLSGLTLLRINDINFKALPGEIEDFAVLVATNNLDTPQITAWLHDHISD